MDKKLEVVLLFEKEVDALTEKVFEAVKKTLVKKTGK